MSRLSLETSSVAASAGLQAQYSLSPRVGELLKYRVDWRITPVGVVKVATGTKIQIQGCLDDSLSGVQSGITTPVAGDGAVHPAVLAVGSTEERVAFDAFAFRIGGLNKNKAADAAGVAFTAEHKVAANKFGCIAINIKADGTIDTQINSAVQTDTLDFDSAVDALANIQNVNFTPTTDYIRIGYILIANDGSLWTANTDDLTDAGDLTTATFSDLTSSYHEIATYTLTATDLLLGKGTIFFAETKPNSSIRLALSAIVGDGLFNLDLEFIPLG